jgi:hypothetical protein
VNSSIVPFCIGVSRTKVRIRLGSIDTRAAYDLAARAVHFAMPITGAEPLLCAKDLAILVSGSDDDR